MSSDKVRNKCRIQSGNPSIECSRLSRRGWRLAKRLIRVDEKSILPLRFISCFGLEMLKDQIAIKQSTQFERALFVWFTPQVKQTPVSKILNTIRAKKE